MGAKIDKIKAFVARHKKDILFVGGTILAVTVTAAICKSDKEKEEVVVERLPEWAEKWKDHCNEETLLYENGLPVFANEEQTKVFRDACDPDSIPDLMESGFEIVDRV